MNKANDSRQGSFADLSLDELQETGRQLVEAGLQKWRDDGKIEDGMTDNFRSFKVSSFYSLLF